MTSGKGMFITKIRGEIDGARIAVALCIPWQRSLPIATQHNISIKE